MNMVNYQQMPPPPHYSPSYTNNPNYSASSLQLPHANSNPNMQHYQQPLPHSHSHPNLIQQSSSNITQIPIQQQQQPQTLQQWQFQQPQNPQSSNPSQYTKPLPPLNSSQPAVQQYQQMFIPVQQDVVNPPSQAKNNVGYGYASQNNYMPPQNYPYVYASHHSNDASSNSSVSNSLSNSENNPNQRFVKSDNKMVTHLSYEKQYPPLHNRNASDSNNYLTHSSRPNSGSPTVQSYLPPYSDVAVYSPLSQPQQMAPSRPLSSQHHQQQQHHQQLPATSRPPNPTNPAYQQPCSVVNSSNLTPDQQPASQHSFYGSQLIAPGQYPDSRLPDQNLVSYPGGYGYQVNNNMYTSNTSYIPATSYNYNNSTNNNINHATFGSNHMDKKFVPELKRGYENLEDESSKKSSIAGVIYNSSAVFKRLKPCLAEEKTESIYKQESNRSQGRPFSSNLTGRFIFHGGLKSLLNHVDKKNNNKFVVYNMDKKWDTDDSTATEKKDKEVNNVDATDRGENNLPSKESDRITQILFKNLKDSLNDNSGFRMGIINDKLNSEITMEALDTFLNCKHDDVLKIDGYREQYNPTQKVISYNPKTKVNIKSSVQSEIKSEEVIGPEVQLKVDDGKDDASPNPNPETIPDRRFNFHLLIKEAFGFEDYVFVKTIRDNNGHILKLETIKPPSDEKGDYNYSPEWLKRRICYPRYKGGMNLHILGPEFNFVLYNDLKMLLWDIKEEILGRDDKSLDKFLNSSALNIIDDDLKKKLFGNRIVYTQTLDR